MSLKKIIPMDKTDPSDRWVPIPNRCAGSLRLKGLFRRRGNCYFASGVPKDITTFSYRVALKLGLTKRTIIISRGLVRSGGLSRKDLVSLQELDWDVGMSMIIPRSLSRRERLEIRSNEATAGATTMELIVLAGFLRIAQPGRLPGWYNKMAMSIMLNGWKSLNSPIPKNISIQRINKE